MTDLFITFALIGVLIGVSTASYRATTWLLGLVQLRSLRVWALIKKLWKNKKLLLVVPRRIYYNKFVLPRLKLETRQDGDRSIVALAQRIKEASARRWRGPNEVQN